MRAASAGLGVILVSTMVLGVRATAQTASEEIPMYAGPGDRFPVIATVARDSTLEVRGCVEGYRWCDVAWQNNRGWVVAERVIYPFEDRTASLREIGSRLDIPIVGFSFASYWDDFYKGQPWYAERERWQNMWREQPDYLTFGRSGRVNQTAGREFDNDNRQNQMNRGLDQDNRNGPANGISDRSVAGSDPGVPGSDTTNEADRNDRSGASSQSGIGQPAGRTGDSGSDGSAGNAGRSGGLSGPGGGNSSSGGSSSGGSSGGGGSGGGGGGG